MKRDLLKILADYLANEVPVERFDMRIWASNRSCGFAGCALGWAAQNEQLKEAGLRTHGRDVYFRKVSGLEAAMEFFGISGSTASRLFLPTSYMEDHVTPTRVANRIHELLSTQGKDD